jgi:fucose 4-O-acetylase-like acetyltransferase
MITPNLNYVAIPFIALWLVYTIIYYIKQRRRIKKRIKPFDCPYCISFWWVFGYEIVNVYQSFTLYSIASLIVNCIVYTMIAMLLEKIYKNL